jgi:flavin-dependent dehydrogenase
VLLVEQKRRIGALPHCAEFVPRALSLELDIPEKAKVQEIIGMESWLGDVKHRTPGPGWVLDRQVFDFYLGVMAAKAGAEVWTQARVQKLDQEKAEIRLPHGLEKVKAKAVVLALGAGSRFARDLTGQKPSFLTGVQVVAPLVEPVDRTLIIFDPEIKGGYGWLFPRGDVANLGLGCLPEAGPVKALDVLRRRMLNERLIKPGILGRGGGAIPISGPVESFIRGKIILAGDSAGLTHPVTGGGIPQAVFSGQEAGKAAVALVQGNFEAAGEYEKELRLRYGRYLSRALKSRRLLADNWGVARFDELMKQTWPAWAGEQRKKAKKAK